MKRLRYTLGVVAMMTGFYINAQEVEPTKPEATELYNLFRQK